MCLIDYYSQNKNKSLLMIHGLFFLITVCCFCYFDYFLLSDYPNYLARVHLYNHLSDSHSVLSEYYYKDMKITPYMAFPVIVGFLEPIVGIYWAGKIFIIFALSMIVSGGLFLNYTLYNRITPFSLFIHIFMFNFTLSMGFMNFTLGLGLVLWGFALWIKYYNHNFKFYSLFSLCAISVFLTHIFSLFLLGLVVGLYQLSNSPKSTYKDFFKSSFYAGLQVLTFTIIPIIVMIVITITQKNGVGFPAITAYHEDLLVNFTLAYVTPLNFELNHIPTLVMITLFMVLIIKKKIRFKNFFVLSLLFALGLCVPFYVAGVACTNQRIPALLGLLFAVSVQFRGSKKDILYSSVLMGILGLFLYGININLLNTHNNWVSEFVATLKDDTNLHGKKLLTVNDDDNVHYHNLSNYAVLEANMFDPELITYIPPINMYKKYAKIYGCQEGAIDSKKLRMSDAKVEKYLKKFDEPTKKSVCPNHFYWKNWRHDFDYVFWIHANKKPKDVPSELSVYKQGSFFTIYKINKKKG